MNADDTCGRRGPGRGARVERGEVPGPAQITLHDTADVLTSVGATLDHVEEPAVSIIDALHDSPVPESKVRTSPVERARIRPWREPRSNRDAGREPPVIVS